MVLCFRSLCSLVCLIIFVEQVVECQIQHILIMILKFCGKERFEYDKGAAAPAVVQHHQLFEREGERETEREEYELHMVQQCQQIILKDMKKRVLAPNATIFNYDFGFLRRK